MKPYPDNKKLIEYDPKELDIMMLSQLQASLVEKLILVNQEFINRNKRVVELGKDRPDTEKAKLVLTRHIEHLKKFNSYLQSELARIMGQGK